MTKKKKKLKPLNLTEQRADELKRAMDLMGTESFTECIDTLLAFYLAMMVLPHPGESVSFPCPGVKDTKDTDTTQVYNGSNERELRRLIDVVIDFDSDTSESDYENELEMIDAVVDFAASKGFKR